jgi:hypothetical protein
LINEKFKNNITSRIFHSKADDIEHEDEELFSETGEIEIKTE